MPERTSPQSTVCGPLCACRTRLQRRDFIKLAGAGAAYLALGRSPSWGDESNPSPQEAYEEFSKLVPPEKNLDPDWLKTLFDRGTPTKYHGHEEIKYIGMPVGGITTGQLYLGGDGKLWHWDIFNQHWATGDGGYAHPSEQSSQIEQGFTLRIDSPNGGAFPLDKKGFNDIIFTGQYPIGQVEYNDTSCPLAVKLEAFSPFIPLDVDNSSLPATVLHFTLKNTSNDPVDATLAGHLENGVLIEHRDQLGQYRNKLTPGTGMTFLNCSAESTADQNSGQPDVIFEDWDKDDYQGWTVEGEAFGTGPVKRSDLPTYIGDVGGEGVNVINSHASAPGSDIGAKDAKTGKLTSADFTINHKYIYLWVGGGDHKGTTCVNLVVDGKVADSVTGSAKNQLVLQHFDTSHLQNKTAHLEIVDNDTGSWGNIGVGRITFTDRPKLTGKFEDIEDFGTMGLGLLGAAPELFLASVDADGFTAKDPAAPTEATAPLGQKLIGAIGRKVSLAAGQSASVTFVLSWNFPNLVMDGMVGGGGRHYAVKFPTALDVAQYIATNMDSLAQQTYLWRDTWYDSTLPYWFLDNSLCNVSCLATSTAFRFKSGRFYGNEGVGCCVGTCTHVWHYEQGLGRLFPQLDILLREMADFDPKVGFNDDGGIGMRGEFDHTPAVDGHSGCILRAYRDHQMSTDSQFLQRNWANIKKAIDYLIHQDGNNDGILEGAQHNTLDAAWYGKVPWLSSLYQASLHAGEAMAIEMGDTDYAQKCRSIYEPGMTNFVQAMWKPDFGYFIQVPDPDHPKAVGAYDGCEISQVMGQHWAMQVGLPGRVLPQEQTKQALASLYKYNFTTDVGPYRSVHKNGRWYAMPGEGGVIGCTWPFGEETRIHTDYDYYFNECQNGYEYQPAAHMIWEGLVQEGFVIGRALFDRYNAKKRNPYNQVECGDHYSRAMASYGLFTAACGYEHHGPKGYLGFFPRVTPENFRAPFTSAAGWGTFSQQVAGTALTAQVALKWGSLRLTSFGLGMQSSPNSGSVTLNGANAPSSVKFENGRAMLTFAPELNLKAGDQLVIKLA
jgi:uncharacterized protein (DUF608 family)